MRVENLKFKTFFLIFFFSFFARAEHGLLNYEEKKLIVKLAQTKEEKRVGFMFKKEIKNFSGILFIYETPEIVSFWMKNTFLDLSIAFIDKNNKIFQIKKGNRLTSDLITSSRSVSAVLELPYECSKKINLTVGKVVSWKKININQMSEDISDNANIFSCFS